VLVSEIAYRPNVDMRESPSVEIMDQLRKHGAHVSYSDPWVPVFPKMRRYQFDLESILLDADTIAGFDCVVVATNHDIFDYSMIKNNSKSVVDAWMLEAFSETRKNIFFLHE